MYPVCGCVSIRRLLMYPVCGCVSIRRLLMYPVCGCVSMRRLLWILGNVLQYCYQQLVHSTIIYWRHNISSVVDPGGYLSSK